MVRPSANPTMKKTVKSALKSAKTKGKKAPAGSQAATGDGESAKTGKRLRQAAVRKPAKRARVKKRVSMDLDHLGDLPRSYGEERIFVVAQEPHWLFCYWDDALTAGVKETIFLRHARTGADDPEAEVPVPAETNTWYLAVQQADAGYLVELGFYRGTRWQTLVRSGTVLTPRDTVAGFGQPVFANLPLQATRQPLGEIIRRARRGDESRNDTLARFEGRGELPVDRLAPAQRTALERLLDTQTGPLTSGALAGSPGSSGAGLFSGAW